MSLRARSGTEVNPPRAMMSRSMRETKLDPIESGRIRGREV